MTLLTAFLFAASIAPLTPGDPLPELTGETLSKTAIALPQAAHGKVALLALGFSYESRFAVEDWVKRFRGTFGKDPRVTFYEVPMVGGFTRWGKWFIETGMRHGTPKADYERVITVYGDVSDWKARVSFKGPDDAYAIIIDAKGVVRFIHGGRFNEAYFEKAAGEVRKLLESKP